MNRPRITPSFVVAVLALVVAAGGTGYAAGQITSSQIQDGTIQSRDVRNYGLTGLDGKTRSLPRDRISTACASGWLDPASSEAALCTSCAADTPSAGCALSTCG